MVYIKIAWRVVKYAVVKIRTLAQMLPPQQLKHYTNQLLKRFFGIILPSCPEEREVVFQRFLPLSILTLYKQKGFVSLSAYRVRQFVRVPWQVQIKR